MTTYRFNKISLASSSITGTKQYFRIIQDPIPEGLTGQKIFILSRRFPSSPIPVGILYRVSGDRVALQSWENGQVKDFTTAEIVGWGLFSMIVDDLNDEDLQNFPEKNIKNFNSEGIPIHMIPVPN